MVRNKSELIEQIKTFIGDNDSDEALAILEDVTDSFTDLESKSSDPEDWKKKYEDNDKEWRRKYKERFSAPVRQPKGSDDEPDVPDEPDEPDVPDEKELTYDNLFKSE